MYFMIDLIAMYIFRLFCAIVVYVVGGMLYQRLVNGAKGMEQFPNIEFWRDFGNLQAVSIIKFVQCTLFIT